MLFLRTRLVDTGSRYTLPMSVYTREHGPSTWAVFTGVRYALSVFTVHGPCWDVFTGGPEPVSTARDHGCPKWHPYWTPVSVLPSLTHLAWDSRISDASHALPPHGGNLTYFHS